MTRYIRCTATGRAVVAAAPSLPLPGGELVEILETPQRDSASAPTEYRGAQAATISRIIRRDGAVSFSIVVALAVVVLLVVAQDFAIARYFPHLPRVVTDFSPAYFQRELDTSAAGPPRTIFLGDSVVWGYRLAPNQTAVAILAARNSSFLNLSFKAGSPPNDYAIVRLLGIAKVHPKAVVLQVNQKVLNAADQAYRTLHPALATLTDSLLTKDDRARLILPLQSNPVARAIDRALSDIWLLYAMRSDIRETVFGEPESNDNPHPSAQDFEGSYDLRRLDERNVGVHFLEKTLDLLHQAGIPVLAFMTPTNHRLLHEYIDNDEYRANAAYLKRLLARRGAQVLDLDEAFRPDDFFDNDHLTAAAQARLAAMLGAALDNLTHSPQRGGRAPVTLK